MCLRWGDAVPQLLPAHPRAVEGKVSPNPSLLAGDALLAFPCWLRGCPQAPLASRTVLLVEHGPQVSMSEGGRQQLPGLHAEISPCPAPGLLHRHSPLLGDQPSAPTGGQPCPWCQEEPHVYRFSPGWYWGSVEVK